MAFSFKDINWKKLNVKQWNNILNSAVDWKNHYKLFIDFTQHDTEENLNNDDYNYLNDILNVGSNLKSNLVQIPVNPERLGLSNSSKNETADLLGLGEINLLKGSKLRTFKIDSFFPDNYQTVGIFNNLKDIYNVITGFNLFEGNEKITDFNRLINSDGFKYGQMAYNLFKLNNVPPYVTAKVLTFTPQQLRQLFENAVNNNQIVKVVFTGVNISMHATIESFDWDIRAGDPDIWYSAEFKEYKHWGNNCITQLDYSVGDVVKFGSDKFLTSKYRLPMQGKYGIGTIIKTDKTNDSYTIKTNNNQVADKASLVTKLKRNYQYVNWYQNLIKRNPKDKYIAKTYKEAINKLNVEIRDLKKQLHSSGILKVSKQNIVGKKIGNKGRNEATQAPN